MATPKTIGNFGGPFTDAVPRTDPETEMDSDEGNALLETVAHMSNTSPKAIVRLATHTGAAGALGTTMVSHRSHWGSGDGQKPTVTKTATGRYTIAYSSTFAATYSEAGSGGVETVSFWSAPLPGVMSGDESDDLYAEVLTISGNTVTIKVESPRGVLADAGDQSAASIAVTVPLFG